jgi:very-short-patch-repair endonuclease
MSLRGDSLYFPYNPALVVRAKALRKNMTPAERMLWFEYLRQFRLKFYRQRPIDHYIVDFFVPN